MKALKDVDLGTTITVTRVAGGRKIQKNLEAKQIMAGSDLTVKEKLDDGGMVVDSLRGPITLTAEEASCIAAGKHYVRTSEPILLGCCGSNAAKILARAEETGGNTSE